MPNYPFGRYYLFFTLMAMRPRRCCDTKTGDLVTSLPSSYKTHRIFEEEGARGGKKKPCVHLGGASYFWLIGRALTRRKEWPGKNMEEGHTSTITAENTQKHIFVGGHFSFTGQGGWGSSTAAQPRLKRGAEKN